MKKIFNLLPIVILLTPVFLKAQYSKQDYGLVKTTFERKFDHNIIKKYLDPGDTKKINAALLSLAQSEDKSFIPTILKLNFGANFEFICFALGQLGPDKAASEFLLKNLTNKSVTNLQRYHILNAIGKTGDSTTLMKLTKNYLAGKWDNYNGIAISLFDFSSRGIIDKDKFSLILRNELLNKNFSTSRRHDAAFAIYRTNLSDEFKELSAELLKEEIKSNPASDDAITFRQYLFENLRKAKFFPDDSILFQTSLEQIQPMLRIEAAKVLPYFRYNSTKQVDDYLQLLVDDNPVVSRQAAISIGEISIPDNLKNKFVENILKYLNINNLTSNTRGELFLNYIKFNPQSFEEILANFKGKIEYEFLYRASGKFTSEVSAFKFLADEYRLRPAKKRMLILQEFLNFQKSFSKNPELHEIILAALSSSSPALISIAADGIDSIFISANKDKLTSICNTQINNNINNPEFSESLISIYNLSVKLSDNLSKEIAEKLQASGVYSISQFAKSKLNLPHEIKMQNNQLMDSIWANAFKYHSAVVNTIKGSFEFIFTSEFAPVSVGNFCYLASQKYFNKIIFHRVVPGFVIQSGDSSSTGWGGPGYEIVSEFSPLHYSLGAVGMASAGKDTEGSQWFVTTAGYPHLNRRYTIFGFVTTGMAIVNTIDQGDEITSIELIH